MNNIRIGYFLDTWHKHPYKVIYRSPEDTYGSSRYEYDRKTGDFEPGVSREVRDLFEGKADYDVEEVPKEIFDARVQELRDEIGVGEIEERLFNAEVKHWENYDYSKPDEEQRFYYDDHR